MPVDLAITYCIVIFVASIIPGPSMILALNHGGKYGFLSSNYSAFGNVTASVIQAIISLFIIYQIGSVNENVLSIIKYIGAIYIIYIGLSMMRSNSGQLIDNETDYKKSLFTQGFLFAIANPKAIIFFAALFPKFTNTNAPFFTQLLTLITPIALIAYICFIAYVFFGKFIVQIFSRNKYVNRTLATAVILAGLAMIFI